MALLEDPFSAKLLDIIVFDVLPSNGDKENQVLLVEEVKEKNPLRYAFKVIVVNPFSYTHYWWLIKLEFFDRLHVETEVQR